MSAMGGSGLPARGAGNQQRLPLGGRSAGLVDVLDRILDKGLVIAGDIRVSLAEIELITVRIRLIVCSVDKAESIGMDWWRTDPYFSSLATKAKGDENGNGGAAPKALAEDAERRDMRALEARLADLDNKLAALLAREAGPKVALGDGQGTTDAGLRALDAPPAPPALPGAG